MPTSTERLVDTNGVRLRVIEAGDRGAPVVVLAHGFPELAYSWRHQIPALVQAGYHVLAPDQRGYGGSSRPDAIDAYNIRELTADIVGLLDDVGAERAVWVGHDWGAPVVWTCATAAPRPGRSGRRVERPADAALQGAPDAGVAQDIRRELLLHPVFPGARRRRRRTQRRSRPHHPPDDGRPTDIRRQERGVADGGTGPGRLHRSSTRTRCAAGLDKPGRTRPLHHRILPHRIHRRAELVPQFRPQLGDSPPNSPTPRSRCRRLFIGGTADPVLGFIRADRATEMSPGRTAR